MTSFARANAWMDANGWEYFVVPIRGADGLFSSEEPLALIVAYRGLEVILVRDEWHAAWDALAGEAAERAAASAR